MARPEIFVLFLILWLPTLRSNFTREFSGIFSTTCYLDLECKSDGFTETKQAINGECYLSYDENGLTGSSLSLIVIGSYGAEDDTLKDAPYSIVTSFFSFSTNCTGDFTPSVAPIFPGECSRSSTYAGSFCRYNVTLNPALDLTTSLGREVVSTEYYSSSDSCWSGRNVTEVLNWRVGACVPSEIGGSKIYLNPSRPIRVDYATLDCTGPGEIMDINEFSCAFNSESASAMTAFQSKNFPVSATAFSSSIGFRSTRFFSNNTALNPKGELYYQSLVKFDSQNCIPVYSSAENDDYSAVIVASKRIILITFCHGTPI